VAIAIGTNVAAWWAYTWPLARLYGLVEGRDRIFNVGAAAIVAAGNSPLERVQVGEAALEPFWTVLIATLALFRPENVVTVYHWLPVLALFAVAIGLYLGMGVGAEPEDRWMLALIVFAVLGLSSVAMTGRSPTPPFWTGNFLFKPNHVAALGCLGLILGLTAGAARWWKLGLALGLLSWLFVMTWAFAAFGLVIGEALRRASDRRLGPLVGALALSSLFALPVLASLLHNYSPTAAHAGASQLWQVHELGRRLAHPDLLLGDLGPGLPLVVGGCVALWRRARPLDRTMLGLVLGGLVTWAVVSICSSFGFAPEPDEVYYYLRFTLALAMGSSLWHAARWIAAHSALDPGRASLLAVACCLPFSFPAYWDPPTMDRYWPYLQTPVSKNIVEYATWIRENTPPDAVFAATPSASYWIPALTGRRVLQSGDSRPPQDHEVRRDVMRTLMGSRDEAEIRSAAALHGVTHLVLDWKALDPDRDDTNAIREVLTPIFHNKRVRIFEVPSHLRIRPSTP
jgi:hypothetical protein